MPHDTVEMRLARTDRERFPPGQRSLFLPNKLQRKKKKIEKEGGEGFCRRREALKIYQLISITVVIRK